MVTKEQINRSLLRIDVGLRKYTSLQDSLKKVDVSKDQDFQKRFNHFYRVRRNVEWQLQFYRLLEVKKKKGVLFKDALNEIYKNTGRLEASLASKLIATIDPNMPVIDKFVLENVGLKLPYSSAKNREEKILSVYNQLQTKLEEFLQTETGKYLTKKFPKENITKTKMVDFILWQTR